MVNDPIGDMLIQIKNAGMAGKSAVSIPYSKLKYNVASILAKEGYIKDVQSEGQLPKMKMHITLRYDDRTHAITNVKRKSKPGLRVYVSKQEIHSVVGGMGIAILSTPRGVMTGKEARKQGVGGELLCEVW